MSSALSHVRRLMAQGVEFETDGVRIRWRNAKDLVSSEVTAALMQDKSAVIDMLLRNQIAADPDLSAEFEERAAILEYDAGLSREDAERQAAREVAANRKASQ